MKNSEGLPVRALFYTVLTCIAAVSLAMAGGPAAPESAEQVIERYIEAVGGREAVEGLSTRTLTGYLIDDLSWHEPPVDSQRLVCRAGSDNRYVVEYTGREGTELEGFDGEAGWRLDFEGVLHSNPDAESSKLAWLVNPHHALCISEYFPNPKLEGTREVEGRVCYAVGNDRPVEYYTLYFDTETGLLHAIGWHWLFDEYREVDGVKLPHRIVCGRKGGSSTYVFESIEHNLPMDDSTFSAPAR